MQQMHNPSHPNFYFFTTTHRLLFPIQHRLQTLALAAALCAVTATTTTAQAQESSAMPPAGDTALGEVTVLGQSLNAADLAAPVTVLEGEDWLLRRSATLGGSLAGEPGIQASHFGAGASRPIIRGMDGPRVGVLANGMELHDASTLSPDHAVASEPLLARQVEVLRGPAALVHGGAVGGVVNVVDDKIPTALPANGIEGVAEVSASSAAGERAGVLGLTTALGPLALRLEGVSRRAGDYRVGAGWQGGRKVAGSFSDSDTGSLGLSWVGRDGYLGVAYTRQTAQYGLPGHSHDFEDCHLHNGLRPHLHCASHHDADANSDHDHDHTHSHTHGHGHDHSDHDEHHTHGTPWVDMRSHRWDVRGEWRSPMQGIEAVRLRASHTRYGHDEVEEEAIATHFRNRAHDVRLEVQHAPLAGWQGVWGIGSGQRQFSAEGEEAYVQPTDTRRLSLFALEEYRLGAWRFQAALHHDRQRVRAQHSGQERKHHGTSASLGVVWRFVPGVPGYQASASISRAQRMPSAEELYANGLHMASSTYELGQHQLGKETSNALELGLRKTSGATTWSLNAYHYRIQGYIYGQTLDVETSTGLQLLQYTQGDARFTGLEGQVRQQLNRHLGVSLWGDAVRAKLTEGGSHLPRIPAARLGVRLDAHWQGWEGAAEWVQVASQSRLAAYETRTGGYGMLNLSLHKALDGTPWQFYLKTENLNNRLGRAHTSFIKQAAPLKGRNLTLGLRAQF